jgi:hypothetical protein
MKFFVPKSFPIILFLMQVSLSFGQLCPKDSLMVLNLNATNITDSIYSSLPKDIRIVLIDYLERHNIEPTDFYVIGDFQPVTIDTISYLEILKINALRDLSDEFFFPGGAGGEGDDLTVVFDSHYKKVLGITNTE